MKHIKLFEAFLNEGIDSKIAKSKVKFIKPTGKAPAFGIDAKTIKREYPEDFESIEPIIRLYNAGKYEYAGLLYKHLDTAAQDLINGEGDGQDDWLVYIGYYGENDANDENDENMEFFDSIDLDDKDYEEIVLKK